MNLNALHRRLLRDVLEIGNAFPFVITGGYAVQAHGLVDRLSRDIDVATNSSIPMTSLAERLVSGLVERGWQVQVIGVDPVSARFMATDPGTGEECEVDILKEGFNRPPEATPYGPVLALDDVIGTKVRALADRGYPRDLVSTFMPHPRSVLRASWNLLGGDVPGMNSASRGSRCGSVPSSGALTTSSRPTAYRAKR
jgi:hypothetical protein